MTPVLLRMIGSPHPTRVVCGRGSPHMRRPGGPDHQSIGPRARGMPRPRRDPATTVDGPTQSISGASLIVAGLGSTRGAVRRPERPSRCGACTDGAVRKDEPEQPRGRTTVLPRLHSATMIDRARAFRLAVAVLALLAPSSAGAGSKPLQIRYEGTLDLEAHFHRP